MQSELDTLQYEFNAISSLTRILDEELTKPPDQDSLRRRVVLNACIEAYCLHARILINFFLQNNVGADEITLRQYIGLRSLPKTGSSKRLNRVRAQLDKRVLHLTKLRSTPYEGWVFVIITGDIFERFRCFLEAVEASEFADKTPLENIRVTAADFDRDYGHQYHEALEAYPDWPPSITR